MIKLGNIKAKATAVIAISTGILTHSNSTAAYTPALLGDHETGLTRVKKRLTSRLVLKLNFSKPEDSKMVDHSSHSSHESHSSHASHGSGYNAGGGFIGPLLFVGGLIGYGVYKSSRKGK